MSKKDLLVILEDYINDDNHNYMNLELTRLHVYIVNDDIERIERLSKPMLARHPKYFKLLTDSINNYYKGG